MGRFSAPVGMNAGTGFAAGVDSGVQNFLGVMNMGTNAKYADLAKKRQDMFDRRQAMDEGSLLSDQAPVTLVGNPSGGAGGPMPEAPQGTPMEDGEVGAQALAAAPQPMQGPPNPYDPKNLSLDDLRALSFERGQQAKTKALGNQNDIESLNKAYHYSAMMKQTKPYMDQWEKGLGEVMKNPKDIKSYRKLQVLTGEDDPDKALALATNEYAKLREQYESYDKNYGPLNEYLTSRGITGDMYDNEAKFIQFMNQKQFMPHSPGASKSGVRSRLPSPRQGR